MRIMISGRNVTSDAQVTPDSFSYRAPLPPGRHTVDVTARDYAVAFTNRGARLVSWKLHRYLDAVSVKEEIVQLVMAGMPVDEAFGKAMELSGKAPGAV